MVISVTAPRATTAHLGDMQIDRSRRFGLSILAAATWVGLGGCHSSTSEPEEAPAILDVGYFGASTLPASYLQVVGGPDGQVVMRGADFQLDGSYYRSSSLTLADNPGWPITVALVTPNGDTLAQITAALPVERKHVIFVGVHALRNRYSWFVCSEVQRKVAIRQLEAAPAQPPDTLYLWASAQIPGVQYPVC